MTEPKRPKPFGVPGDKTNAYWMRALSFAGLHRLLSAIADFPSGLRAGEINELVRENDINLTQRTSPPALTTLYHYRNTLLRLNALQRDGSVLRVNTIDPDVCQLLSQPAPPNGVYSLSDAARGAFSALVLRNIHCRSLFFDLFMPKGTSCISVCSFLRDGLPVNWSRYRSTNKSGVVFESENTGKSLRCATPANISALLYGVRYWARNELRIIDEYCKSTDGSSVMFPVCWPKGSTKDVDSAGLRTVRFLLSLRTSNEWTLFSILDLILRCCVVRKQPRSVLFRAIDWFLQDWPHHTVLIPTSHALATLTAPSPQAEKLQLRNYYKSSKGQIISHIRLHRDISTKSIEDLNCHVQHT